ncbi:MAG: hypothetical protein U9Q82_06260, partial [Chloroflexota bacterium]|nr:hypothetical protein [Chloroflexota bacterium]
YAQGYDLPLVFVTLSPPWVQEMALTVFRDMSAFDTAAVVMADWKDFGELPVPAWGWVRR